jgi:putative DNA primase/helicase
MFRASSDVVLGRKALSWPAKEPDGKPIVVFELRAGDIQDVLPPTIHPGTGKPYIWLTPPNSEFPLLPEALLELWQHWDSYRKELEAMCPWAKHGFNPEPAPRGDGARPNVIAAFNQVHTVEDLLVEHGYTRRGNRWMSPTSSSGLAGVTILDGGRVYSHHGADPLADGHSHDAFDLFRILDHGGDARVAIKAAAEDLGMGSAAGANQDKNGQRGAGTDQAETKAEGSGIVVLEISELLLYGSSRQRHRSWRRGCGAKT